MRNQGFYGTSYLVVVIEAVVVVSPVLPGSEKTRSVKTWKMDEVVEETGGVVMLGGAMVFMR